MKQRPQYDIEGDLFNGPPFEIKSNGRTVATCKTIMMARRVARGLELEWNERKAMEDFRL